MSPDRHQITPSEICRIRGSNLALAKMGLSLYRPADLHHSLAEIAYQFTGVSPAYSGPSAAAYYLGHEVASLLWNHSLRENPAAPFVGLEEVSSNLPMQPTVARIGCPSISSYHAENSYFQKIGLSPNRRHLIEITPLPVRKLEFAFPDDSFTCADATTFHFDRIFPDLILTDLIFSDPSTDSVNLLSNLTASLPIGGNFLTRVCLLDTRSAINYFRLMDLAGEFWGEFSRMQFGEDDLGRDQLYGLTRSQWREFGRLYSQFVQQTFFPPNRFSNEQATIDFFRAAGLVLEKRHLSEYSLGPGIIGFLSLCFVKHKAV